MNKFDNKPQIILSRKDFQIKKRQLSVLNPQLLDLSEQPSFRIGIRGVNRAGDSKTQGISKLKQPRLHGQNQSISSPYDSQNSSNMLKYVSQRQNYQSVNSFPKQSVKQNYFMNTQDYQLNDIGTAKQSTQSISSFNNQFPKTQNLQGLMKNSDLLWLEVENLKLRKDSGNIKYNFKQVKSQDRISRTFKLYDSLQKEQRDKNQKEEEEKLRIEQEQTEKGIKDELQIQLQKEQQMIEEEWKKQLEDLRIKRMKERRISVWDALIALHYNCLHNEIPGSKIFAKLVAKNLLNILNFKAIEAKNLVLYPNRYKNDVEQQFIRREALNVNINVNLNVNVNAYQLLKHRIVELQYRLNEGLILQSDNQRFQKGIKRQEVIAFDEYSPWMVSIIKKLQYALQMGVFKINRTQSPERISKQFSNLIDIKAKSALSSALKLTMGKLQSRNRTIHDLTGLLDQTDDLQLREKQNSSLSVFSALKIAKLMVRNQIRKTDQNNQRLIPQQELLHQVAKKVQVQHYPAIKYIAMHDQSLSFIWRIKFKDMTQDKKCLIVYFEGQGRKNNFYRLEIPINKNHQVLEKQPQMTIWPTLQLNLDGYMERRGYMDLFQQYYKIRAKPKHYKLNFIQGLNVKSLSKIQQIDIDAIVMTKQIVQFIKNGLVSKYRKIIGESYELLPQLKSIISQYISEVFLINIPSINSIIYTIRTMELKIEQLRKMALSDWNNNYIEKINQLKKQYIDFTQENIDHLNAILYFRFLCGSQRFYQDQTIKNMYSIANKQLYIQSTIINIEDVLRNSEDVYSQQLKFQALFVMYVRIKDKIKINIQPILFSLSSLETGSPLTLDENNGNKQLYSGSFVNGYIESQGQKWAFNKELFEITIDVTFFERDKSNKNIKELIIRNRQIIHIMKHKANSTIEKRLIQPLKLSHTEFEVLVKGVLKDRGELSITIQKNLLDSILKSIILDKNPKIKQTETLEIFIREAFTIDIQAKQVAIKKKYAYLLHHQQNFIDQICKIGQMNGNLETVHRYSLFPDENKYITRNDISTHDPNQQYTANFVKMFKKIHVNDFIFTPGTTSMKLQIIVNDDQIIPQDDMNSQSSIVPWRCVEMKNIRIIKGEKRVRIVSRFEGWSFNISSLNENTMMALKRMRGIQQILQNESLLKIIQSQMRVSENTLAQRLGIKYAYSSSEQSNQIQNTLNLNYNIMKYKIMSQCKDLVNWLNHVYFVFHQKDSNKKRIIVNVSLYYSNSNELGLNKVGYQKLYLLDLEHIFINLEIYRMEKNLCKQKLIFSKQDLNSMFGIQTSQNTISALTVQEWTSVIIQRIKMEKRFLHQVPYFLSPQSKSQNQDQDLETSKFLRWTNYFSKNRYDQKFIEKKFIECQFQEFRTIGHFIQKVNFIYNDRTQEIQIISNSNYSHKQKQQSISVDFMIVTVQANNILDMWRLTYYFPRSKRRLTTQISSISLQEISIVHFKVFDIFNIQHKFSNLKEFEHIISSNYGINYLGLLQMSKRDQIRSHTFTLLNPRPSIGIQLLRQKTINKNFTEQIEDINNDQDASQISNKIEQLKLFTIFTRKLNQRLCAASLQDRIIEIKIWQYIIDQAISLGVLNRIKQQKQKILETQLIDHYTFKDKMYHEKLLGGKFLKKNRISTSPNHQSYQAEILRKKVKQNIKFLESNEVKFSQPYDISQSFYCLKLGDAEFPIREFIDHIQFKVERLGTCYIECFIESDASSSQIQKQEIMRSISKKGEDRVKLMLQIQARSIFTSQKHIPYSQSASYNLWIRFNSVQNKFRYCNIRINIRELLNLFIADGLFKSQINYMNSKLNLSDIVSMCQYVSFKIKDQNYLDLAQIAFAPVPSSIPLIRETLMDKIDSKFIDEVGNYSTYSFVRKLKEWVVFQLQILIHKKLININQFLPKTKTFTQFSVLFKNIEEDIPYFEQIIYSGEAMVGLIKFSKLIDKYV